MNRFQSVISVTNLGKKYRIAHQKRSDTLRDTLIHGVRNVAHRLMGKDTAVTSEDFWALKDVSFEVQRGDVLGVIGRNGAGKSTLLKILSRITEPTTGKITLNGRIASLLEVGTGFHPELSGRENIFLNGAILGMSRSEIRAKFDEIVAFAEVERFLDTPVKHYSSGMYVRLAFAVAAHLEPEILIVDEVLAVGDVAFQKKCLGKIRSVAQGEGRTVLFVSHNLGALQALCDKALYLRNGSVVATGEAQALINLYNHDLMGELIGGNFAPRVITPNLILQALQITPQPVHSGDAVEFQIELSSKIPLEFRDLCVSIQTNLGVRVAILDFRKVGENHKIVPNRRFSLSGRIPKLPLVEGEYVWGLYMQTQEYKGDLSDLLGLRVLAPRQPPDFPPYSAHDRGVVELAYEYSVVS